MAVFIHRPVSSQNAEDALLQAAQRVLQAQTKEELQETGRELCREAQLWQLDARYHAAKAGLEEREMPAFSEERQTDPKTATPISWDKWVGRVFSRASRYAWAVRLRESKELRSARAQELVRVARCPIYQAKRVKKAKKAKKKEC